MFETTRYKHNTQRNNHPIKYNTCLFRWKCATSDSCFRYFLLSLHGAIKRASSLQGLSTKRGYSHCNHGYIVLCLTTSIYFCKALSSPSLVRVSGRDDY